MGLVIPMTMRFYHIFMSRKKTDKPVGQSFVTATEVGLDIVEVG